jgi:hypothetical protein
MKKITVSLMALMAIAALACLCGCSPSPDEIMRRYEGYGTAPTDRNKAGVSIDAAMLDRFLAVSVYANPVLSENMEYIDLLQDRFWVADAENPTHRFKIKTAIIAWNTTVNGSARPTTYGHSLVLDDMDEAGTTTRYVLVGFKGITSKESPELETAPMFFIIERYRKRSRLLTPQPLLAGDLAQVDFAEAHFPIRTATLTGRNGKNYSLRIGKIGRNDQAFTYIEFHSADIAKEAWFAEGELLKKRDETPFSTTIVAHGQHYQATGYGLAENGGLLIETYATRELPDTVEVSTETGKIVFDGKTKEVVPAAQQ